MYWIKNYKSFNNSNNFNKYTLIIYTLCPSYSLKNKGASRCHIRTFLSKWFQKEPLTSEEPFCFTKGSLWRKKVLQIIKGKKELVLCGTKKWFFYGIAVKNLWSTFILRVYILDANGFVMFVPILLCTTSNSYNRKQKLKLHERIRGTFSH